jgi:hypothetical protein
MLEPMWTDTLLTVARWVGGAVALALLALIAMALLHMRENGRYRGIPLTSRWDELIVVDTPTGEVGTAPIRRPTAR